MKDMGEGHEFLGREEGEGVLVLPSAVVVAVVVVVRYKW